MGLISFHQLFRPTDNQLIKIAELSNIEEIESENEEFLLDIELNTLILQSQIDRTQRLVPIFETLPSPFSKRVANPHIITNVSNWQSFFQDRQLPTHLVQFLTFEDRQTIKQCNRNLKRIISIHTLKNDNNWNLTMNMLAPFILKETQLRDSAYDEHSEDLDRTSGYFENQNTLDIAQHQLKLDRIIKNISFKIKYFQGIMPICASLLQCFNENTSYWVLRYLLFKCHFIQIDIEFYHRYLEILNNQMKILIPDVSQHLVDCGFELNYFVMKWIMGLFSQDMSKTMLLCIWDLICQTDVYFIIYVVITIFKCFRSQILTSDSDHINDMLKASLKSRLSNITCQQITSIAKQLYIKRVLEGQSRFFSIL